MSASPSSFSSFSQDFDLNLAPILDCFVVLIAFVMISTSFAAVGILDAGVAAGGETELKTEVPSVRIAVELQKNHRFLIKLTGKENRQISVGAAGNDWDHVALKQQLDEVKHKYPTATGAVISAADSVKYDEVVSSMDQVRKTFPAVMLGGL
ncbi:MAG: hypothetical protein A3K03_01145 [Bdellovibrionales bacterium RIFOXYD1_FULL_44_7]|nr:MAG: hypothetical protein A3K03_01145 [Bdellovibrionales bacterium RIFOXYD1_FULL_44_7]